MQDAYPKELMNSLSINKNIKVNFSTWLLALYLFLAPLDFLQVISGVSLPRFLIFLPLIGFILRLQSIRIYIDRYLVIPLVYVLMIIMTIFYSYDLTVTLERTISIGLNVAIILILSTLKYNQKELLTIKKAMIYSGWLTLSLMYFYSDTSLMGGRMTVVVNGSYQDPNYLCGFLIFSIIFYYEGFIKKRSKMSFIKMCIFLVFVLLTGSRGGLLAIIGSVFFYTIIWIKESRYKFATVFKLNFLFLSIIFFFFISLNMLPDSVSQRYDISFTKNDGGANRFEIWNAILSSYQNLPLINQVIGTGAGTIRHFNYFGTVGHNIWIESLIEIGIVGTVILFIFYFMHLLKAYIMRENVVSASIVGYLIMTMSMSLYSYKPIWNIILLVMLLKNSKSKN
jgi:hypothetical protein